MADDLLQLLDHPAYPPALTARLCGLSQGRVRRWLRGYEYTYAVDGHPRHARKAPVVTRQAASGSTYSSFLDLVDLLFVKRFLDEGISLQRVRRALREAEHLLGGHHFAQRKFFTAGKEIFLEVNERPGADALLQLLADGQWVIAPVIKKIAKQIEFDDTSGFALRWFPLGKRGGVVLDPRIAFGAPTLTARPVKTANVYDLYLAENRDTGRVGAWMSLRDSDVDRAVAFEERMRRAA